MQGMTTSRSTPGIAIFVMVCDVFVTVSTTCSHPLSGYSGSFSSPNFPNNYPDNQHCVWTITASSSYDHVTLEFNSFRLEAGGSQCLYDFVEIRNGSSAADQLLGKYCASNMSPRIVSSGKYMRVYFHSDGGVTSSGFSANYVTSKSACSRSLFGYSGSFSSPNFPNNYNNDDNCVWSISVPYGYYVALNFTSFLLESHRCIYDFVEIRDGSTAADQLLGKYCGSNMPPRIISSGDDMRVYFHSDGVVIKSGFSAHFVAILSACSRSLSGYSGSFSSPNFPYNYPDNQHCVWSISVPYGYYVALDFSSFFLQSNSTCSYDYVEIRDSSIAADQRLGKYCGSNMPPRIISSGNDMRVYFHSDASVTSSGFSAKFVAILSVAPQFIEQPRNRIAIEGQNVTFPCKVSGMPEPVVKWSFSGESLPRHITGKWNLTLLSVNNTDKFEGHYTCAASSQAGFSSTGAILVVDVLPKILFPLQDMFIEIGERLELRCNTRADPAAHIAWTKDNSQLPASAVLYNNNSTLIIYSVVFGDDGRYTCVATNRQGKTSSSATVEVQARQLIHIPRPHTLTLKNYTRNITIDCYGYGKPLPTVVWKKDGKEMKNVSEFSEAYNNQVVQVFEFAKPSQWNVTGRLYLRAAGITYKESGIYTCEVFNGVGTNRTTEQSVEVLFVPQFLERPTNQVVIEGQNVTFPCKVSGVPEPSVQWNFSGGSLPKRSIKNWDLTLFGVNNTEKFEGSYSCAASSRAGFSSKVASLVVDALPKILPPLQDVYVQVGERLELICNTSADPEAKIAWTRDNSWLPQRATYKNRNSTLIIDSVMFDDDGRYTCVATNRQGSVSSSATVEVQDTSDMKAGTCPSESCSCEKIHIAYGVVIAVLVLIIVAQCWRNHGNQKHKSLKCGACSGKEIPMDPILFTNNLVTGKINPSADFPNTASGSPTPPSEYMALVPQNRSWELKRSNINVIKIIGKGAFSNVGKATATGIRGIEKEITVAVKMLKENAPNSDRKDLLAELELMKTFKPHSHVIKLLGCVTESEPPMVVIEYAPYGDLLGYLKKSRGLNDTSYKNPDVKPRTNLTSQQLMSFAWQIADGMNYLASKKVIHRDLAARNVLVGEGEKCKVTNFGMARDVHQDDIYTKRGRARLPVKWTAYESLLYGVYSTQSDVWSYGVVLYEIFTIGGRPYPNMDGRLVAARLQEGYRIPKPAHLEDRLYCIMTDCWKENPSERPTFSELKDVVAKMKRNHRT